MADQDRCFGVWADSLVAREYFVFWDSFCAVHLGLATRGYFVFWDSSCALHLGFAKVFFLGSPSLNLFHHT